MASVKPFRKERGSAWREVGRGASCPGVFRRRVNGADPALEG